MLPQLMDSLKITAIGMGLVFIAILVLWGLMELLVQVTVRRVKAEIAPRENELETGGAAPSLPDANLQTRQRAAAAAVATALALQDAKSDHKPIRVLPAPKEQASAWQTLMRASHLNQRSSLFTRKPRGRVR
ncbi:hypothetical protein ADN00_10955 [Ornatilinea apprima]|uniref:Uncharacterized protein n=1 Tax=Ornatilinea apprima TaxID=1134406 RepID=A0A0P6XKF5_9CHLR|nr:OadG family protein [Ornatilinea apprima]KPL76486.1 hypothetical protein ADN00_10955 [Ornatilinea apprima]